MWECFVLLWLWFPSISGFSTWFLSRHRWWKNCAQYQNQGWLPYQTTETRSEGLYYSGWVVIMICLDRRDLERHHAYLLFKIRGKIWNKSKKCLFNASRNANDAQIVWPTFPICCVVVFAKYQAGVIHTRIPANRVMKKLEDHAIRIWQDWAAGWMTNQPFSVQIFGVSLAYDTYGENLYKMKNR